MFGPDSIVQTYPEYVNIMTTTAQGQVDFQGIRSLKGQMTPMAHVSIVALYVEGRQKWYGHHKGKFLAKPGYDLLISLYIPYNT